MVYDLKPKGVEKTCQQLGEFSRVGWDYSGKPVVRIAEPKDLIE